MKRRGLYAAIGVCLLAASVASAALGETYRDWADGPVKFLLTRSERKAFKKLTTDDEARRFIELFWAKRDPDLGTTVNEFKLEFEHRVRVANEKYSFRDTPGSLTDRGKTLILLGQPDAIQEMLTDIGAGTVSGRSAIDKGARELWLYSKAHVPSWAPNEDVTFVFVESRHGRGDFSLPPGDVRNAPPLRLLQGAPGHLVLHPDLTEPPRPGLADGARTASEAELESLDAALGQSAESAPTIAVTGVQSTGEPALWVWVELPNTTPAATTLIGRVTGAESGEAAGTLTLQPTRVDVAGARGYPLTLQLEPGRWRVELALLDGSRPLAVSRITGEVEEIPSAGTWISPGYASATVFQRPGAGPAEPFTVGGWQVAPRPDDRYTRDETMSFFAYLSRPQLDEQGQPKVEVSMALYHGDQKLSESPVETLPTSRVGQDLWMFGSRLPLKVLPGPGDFRLEITMREPTSGTSRTTSVPITIANTAP